MESLISKFQKHCIKKPNEWEHIFKFLNIDTNKNIQYITSKDIKNCKKTFNGKSQFEPRLLCKMDSYESRPDIFKKHNIFLLSIKNGKYILLKENIYIKLNKYYNVPYKIEKICKSLLLDIGNSETSMLDNMLYNNILSQIIGETVLRGPLMGGRHRCSFKTHLQNSIIEIEGSQYETDGCYETENYVCIVEAKSKQYYDFNIRQLYYPFREVHKKIGDTKKIIALFIYKDKRDVIHVHKFKWNDYEKMLDIEEIGYYSYVF